MPFAARSALGCLVSFLLQDDRRFGCNPTEDPCPTIPSRYFSKRKMSFPLLSTPLLLLQVYRGGFTFTPRR
ncbi:hypothetical protein N658DRAFT_496900 [Parathielavia hyrcaniae]|uniref:Uncharacterized protein n=1 Tax=Parathielavia hyrcaniae TaxID=113614 RepID=A0AAN6T0P9_9PEZI|nr:hypothetical protein N658DRAFT_496900 [Parathielavia hyrcaniae]